jgi:alpha-galactosidase
VPEPDFETPDVAATPPMGWLSWGAFKKNIDGDLIRAQADAMVELGLLDAGYEYLVVDGGWRAAERDENGDMQADPEAFPEGIASLAEDIHDRGLKFGLHQGVGMTDCAGETPGTQSAPGGELQDAARFADWGVDYLKYDMCGGSRYDYPDTPVSRRNVARRAYTRMGDALAAQDRDIVYSVCDAGAYNAWEWAADAGAHLWRTAGDLGPHWRRIEEVIDRQAHLAPYAGPGGWNDPDMLYVGDDTLSPAEWRLQFSVWSVLSAPLLPSVDLRDLPGEARSMLVNEDVVAVNQDPAGVQGRRVRSDVYENVWSKPLSGGDFAAVVANRHDDPRHIVTSAAEIGMLGADRYRFRDLWSGEEWTGDGRVEADLQAHDATMLRISPVD